MQRKSNSSLENAFRILKLFSIDHPEMGVTTISRKLNISKSTAHRLLSSLLEEEFVYKNPNTNQYSLGSSILSFVNIVTSQIHISNEAIPFLNMLVERTNESAHLAILEGLDIVYIQTVKGEYTYPYEDTIHLGSRRKSASTSAGQVILAYHPKTAEVVATNADTSPTLFLKKLEVIKKQGYSISTNAYHENEMEFTVPVFDERSRVIASLSISGNSKRLNNDQTKKKFISFLQQASNELNKVIEIRKRGDKR